MKKHGTLLKLLFCGLLSFFFCSLSFADAKPIVLQKEYVPTTDNPGYGNLTLEAFVTGKTITTTRIVNTPLDIVFVMDYSGSMDDTLGGSQTKFDAMWAAIDEFLQKVYEKRDTGNSGTHRVAFVGYASSLEYASSGFTPIADASGNYNASLTTERNTAYNAFDGGGTYMHYGVDAANSLFSANSNVDPVSLVTRQRIIVFLTDGIPAGTGSIYDWNSAAYTEANTTIASAHTAKVTNSAMIYSVGLFSGAANIGSAPKGKPMIGSSDYWYNLTGSSRSSTSCCNALSNGFLHVISSDFPNATGFTDKAKSENSAGRSYTAGYYIPATSTSQLANIFTSISESISSSTASYELESTTVLRDVMSENFDLNIPEGQTVNPSEVIVEKIPCTGVTVNLGGTDTYSWGTPTTVSGVTVTITPKNTETNTLAKVNVTGFDYAANYVGTPSTSGRGYGSKLRITFPVHDNGTGMGAAVPTNDPESGVYTAEEIEQLDDPDNHDPVVGPGNFEVPEVEITYCTVSYWTKDIDGNLVEMTKAPENHRGTTGLESSISLSAASITDYQFDHAENNSGTAVALNNIPVSADGTEQVKFVYEPLAYVHHVKTDGTEVVENVLIYKALDENKKFDITTAVTGIYSGISTNYLYGGLWTDKNKTDLVTADCGKALDPEVGYNYYVREVPDVYMQPKVLGKKMKGSWYVSLVAVIDDPDKYLAAGFGTTDSDMCGDEFSTKYVYDQIAFRYRKNEGANPTVVTILPNDILTKKADTAEDTTEVETELTGKVICCELTDPDAYSDEALAYAPFYVTKDNVRVTGIYAREVSSSTGAAPSWTDTQTGSSTSVYSARKRAMSIAPLKCFVMGEEENAVTVTAYVNGVATEYTIEAGTDARETVEIPDADDMLFAGWYADADFANLADLTNVEADTSIYAKMLSGEYLNVQCFQTNENDEKKLVAVTAIDSAAVASFGFVYSINGQEYTKNIAETVNTYNGQTAAQLFDGVADNAKLCVMYLDLTDLTTETTIKITPYWITKDGIKVKGVRKSMTYLNENVAQ